MTAAKSYTYEYLEADIGLGQVAARFHTTVREVYSATLSQPDSKFRGLTEDEFLRSLRAGDIVVIPYPGDPWDWRSAQDGAATIGDACAKKPEPARAGGPALTPELLWFHISNGALRGSILKRLPNLDAQRKLDETPSQGKLQTGDRIAVPYPVRDKAPPVRVAPAKADGHSAVIEATPEWISRLRAHAEKIGKLSDALAAASESGRKLREEGLAACCHVAALHRIVAIQIKHAPSANEKDLKLLQNAIVSLQKYATELCYPNPASKLGTPDDVLSVSLANQLHHALQDQQLVGDLQLAAKHPDERVLGTTARALADGIQARGYLALAQSHRAGDAKAHADAALDVFNGAGGASSASPLTAYVGIAGNLIALPAAAVGNLPGPASLAVALAEIRIKNRLPEILHKYLEHKNSITVGKSLLALSFRNPNDVQVFVDWASVEKAARTEATLARDAILKGIKLTESEVLELDKALVSAKPADLRKVAADLAGKYQASAGWNAFMGLLSAAALLLTIANDDGDAVARACNIVGQSVTTGLGLLQTMASLRPGGALGNSLNAVGAHFGTFASVTGIFAGAISALTTPTQDVAGILSSGLQMVGGALSVGGFLLGVPCVQVAGTAVVIVSAAVGIWGQLDLSTPGPAKVLLAQLKAFRERSLVVSMIGKYPYLDKSIAQVEDLIKTSGYVGLYVMPATPDIVSFLRGTGIKDEDIHFLAFSPSSQGPKL